MAELDVFLSHNRRQKPWVRDFFLILRRANKKVFFDEEMEPGADFVSEIGAALRDSRRVLFIISPTSVASAWVHRELSIAITYDPDASLRKVIPVVVEPVPESSIPPEIRNLERVDLTAHPRRAEEWEKLMRFLGIPDDQIPACPAWERTVTVGAKPEVESWNWDSRRLLQELIALDRSELVGLTDADEGTVDQWAPVFWRHPDTWRLLFDRPESVVGYWHFVSLREEEFRLASAGQLLDSQITLNKVSNLALSEEHDIYIVTMCLKKGFGDNIAWTRMLLSSFFDVATQLAAGGCFFRNVCANAYTDDGISLCEDLQMTPGNKHVSRGTIYSRAFYPFPKLLLLGKHRELVRLYKQKYS